MRKLSLLLLFIGLAFFINAQEVDYVIKDPEKNKEHIIPNAPDNNKIPNPDYTAYFLNATAYTLDKKKMRLSGTDLFFIKASYGLSDNLMASFNISLFGTFTGSLKCQLNLTEQIKLGAAFSGGRLFYADVDISSVDSSSYFGGGQAMITLGDKQDNITVGTGFYQIKNTFDLFGNGIETLLINNIYIGFQKQIGRKWYIMAEGNYFLNHRAFYIAAGVKVVVGDRISLNLGIMPMGYNDPTNNQTIFEPIPIPLISFRYLLGRNR
ncbi:MAG: hypothetical protein COB15_03090 [Flavobacteriales bacterium]|nr:MAG: hypothetical protein COB15_03090 [Flavobacteriales bacterium]